MSVSYSLYNGVHCTHAKAVSQVTRMVQLNPMREMNPKRRCAVRSVSTEVSARRGAFITWTHFQNLLFAQPSKRLFISDSTPGAADV